MWLFADGTRQSTEAEGPLAKPNRRWVQTVTQRMSCYRKAQREEAQNATPGRREQPSSYTGNIEIVADTENIQNIKNNDGRATALVQRHFKTTKHA